MIRPDLHHDQPLTLQFVEGLIEQCNHICNVLEGQILNIGDVDCEDTEEYELCLTNWQNQVKYAALRCCAIGTKLSFGIETTKDDAKCIDITLCIIRDYKEAKKKFFLAE